MPNTIHMQTEETRALAEQIRNAGQTITTRVNTMLRLSQDSSIWSGVVADHFRSDSRSSLRRLLDLAEQQEDLALALRTEIEQWEQMDSSSQFGLNPVWSPILLPDDTLEPLPFPGERYIDRDFDWGTAIVGAIPLMPVKLVGGIILDSRNGVPFDQALISELYEAIGKYLFNLTGIGWGISQVMSVGHAVSILAEMSGNHDIAITLQNRLAEMDVIDQLGDGAAEFIINLGEETGYYFHQIITNDFSPRAL